MSGKDLSYRPCVGVMMLNTDNQVFVAKRIDTVAEAWQMPQGGIDEGEDPEETALRELKEEIGTNNVEVITESSAWLTYDLPDELIGKVWKGKYRGQTMKWFLMRFLGDDNEIDLETAHPEFHDWKWLPPENLPDMIVPFKKQLYTDILAEFRDHLS